MHTIRPAAWTTASTIVPERNRCCIPYDCGRKDLAEQFLEHRLADGAASLGGPQEILERRELLGLVGHGRGGTAHVAERVEDALGEVLVGDLAPHHPRVDPFEACGHLGGV